MASRTSRSSSTTRTFCILASGDRSDLFQRPLFVQTRREIDPERRALARLGLDDDVGAEALDDTMHERQPPARPHTHRSGGEKRFEYAFGRGWVHAVAGVADPHFDAGARFSRRRRIAM